MEEELKDTQPAAAPVQDNPTPAEAQPPQQDEQLPQEEDTEAATPAPPERPASAITLESVMKLIAEAEERGYERGRKAGADEERENARKCGTGSIWEDTRLAEAGAYTASAEASESTLMAIMARAAAGSAAKTPSIKGRLY